MFLYNNIKLNSIQYVVFKTQKVLQSVMRLWNDV